MLSSFCAHLACQLARVPLEANKLITGTQDSTTTNWNAIEMLIHPFRFAFRYILEVRNNAHLVCLLKWATRGDAPDHLRRNRVGPKIKSEGKQKASYRIVASEIPLPVETSNGLPEQAHGEAEICLWARANSRLSSLTRARARLPLAVTSGASV